MTMVAGDSLTTTVEEQHPTIEVWHQYSNNGAARALSITSRSNPKERKHDDSHLSLRKRRLEDPEGKKYCFPQKVFGPCRNDKREQIQKYSEKKLGLISPIIRSGDAQKVRVETNLPSGYDVPGQDPMIFHRTGFIGILSLLSQVPTRGSLLATMGYLIQGDLHLQKISQVPEKSNWPYFPPLGYLIIYEFSLRSHVYCSGIDCLFKRLWSSVDSRLLLLDGPIHL
ncbi:hypothetical protein IEQ34_018589 [Dendrobium chrysotoxum]|uniref:Uncharacterized protein n=1 Tax=Dendrobium chrysotoxum TaxID=161865 RepID=A0AAV7FNT3_DENCH|nr:hypothetical protein IEQ34_018589 [Dendrobium chrysotoxum]